MKIELQDRERVSGVLEMDIYRKGILLNGAGDFDHPHVEYGKQSGYPTTNMVADINNGLSVSQVITDKYGHVTALLRHQLRWRYNSKAQRIYNAFPDISSDVSLAFTDIVLANGEHISVLTPRRAKPWITSSPPPSTISPSPR